MPERIRPHVPVVAGIALSHAERPVFPQLNVSKLDLALYYAAIERWIVPHVQGRPLTLVHCPQGLAGPCSYLKHAKVWGPAALRRVAIREKAKIGEYMVADSLASVVALTQMGVVEIHTWNSTAADIERPNRIVWDLDPGPAITWAETVTAARLVRDVLQTLGLISWVKTTGGLGLHVVVPIRPSLDWSECLTFARDVSEALVRTDPRRYTTSFARRGREAQILLDYLRNNRTNTSVCAYSPRARPEGPVSVPIRWEELGPRRASWNVLTVRRRLQRLRRDPWAGYWTTGQRISATAMRAIRAL